MSIEDVAINDPTVSCVPVAIIFPAEFVVRIEFGEKVVAVKICEASVDVDVTPNSPFEPMYPNPCPEPTRSSVVLAVWNDE